MSGVDRDVAHVLSGRDNLPYGGVAWGSTLCSYDWGYSVSGYLNGSFPYPLEDNNGGNWDLVVMSHELGHNFGSPHTHDLGIDGCAFGDCSLSADGTIMSYCHTCPGGISNIRLGFNEQIKDTMYSLLEERTCDETGEDVAALDDVVSTFANYDVDIDVLLNDIGRLCGPARRTGDVRHHFGQRRRRHLPAPVPMQPRERLNYDPPLGFTGTDLGYSLAGRLGRCQRGSAESVLNVPLDYPTVQISMRRPRATRSGPSACTRTPVRRARFPGKSIWVRSTNGPGRPFSMVKATGGRAADRSGGSHRLKASDQKQVREHRQASGAVRRRSSNASFATTSVFRSPAVSCPVIRPGPVCSRWSLQQYRPTTSATELMTVTTRNPRPARCGHLLFRRV